MVCQHKADRARVSGMGNIRELLINVVTCEKPKMLIGFAQKGKWLVQGLFPTLSWTNKATGGQRGIPTARRPEHPSD
jgi:hypothetical protein